MTPQLHPKCYCPDSKCQDNCVCIQDSLASCLDSRRKWRPIVHLHILWEAVVYLHIQQIWSIIQYFIRSHVSGQLMNVKVQ